MPTTRRFPAGDSDKNESLTTDGHIAADFLARIGTRIREVRNERSLTVQQLAERSQISRRLLTQIEHGQANPSLVAVTRIARQLGTDFPALIDEAISTGAVAVQSAEHYTLVWSSDKGSTAHLMVSTTSIRSADMWRWQLVPGDVYRGQLDPGGSQELFYVLEGALTLQVDGQEVVIHDGCSARLHSDRKYVYANAGTTVTTFIRTVTLSR